MKRYGLTVKALNGLRSSNDEFPLELQLQQILPTYFHEHGCLIGNIVGTILNDKRNPNVHCKRFLTKANIDSSSYRF